MSFLKSVLFGCEGSYNIFGTRVNFQNELPSYYPSGSLEGAGFISKLASKCINSNTFRWITQGYAHVFIHEMSHALAYKLLTHQNAEVLVIKNLCEGRTSFPSAVNTDWGRTIVDVSGPMGDIAFSTCKLVAATALRSYLSWPVALALGGGAVIWISGELLFAYVSASNKSPADFGFIARRGNTHLVLATIALVSQAALGIFAAIKLAA